MTRNDWKNDYQELKRAWEMAEGRHKERIRELEETNGILVRKGELHSNRMEEQKAMAKELTDRLARVREECHGLEAEVHLMRGWMNRQQELDEAITPDKGPRFDPNTGMQLMQPVKGSAGPWFTGTQAWWKD